MDNNIQVNHHLKHRFFDTKTSDKLFLHIHLGQQFFSYSITKEIANQVVYLKSFNLNEVNNYFAFKLLLGDLLEQEELLKHKFDKVFIAYDAPHYTLVPKKYFEPSEAQQYLSYNWGSTELGKIMWNETVQSDVVIVYGIDYHIIETIGNFFDNFDIQHALTPLLNNLQQENTNTSMYIHVKKKHVDIVIVDAAEQLKFCNSYVIQSDTDLLYYVLNTAKQTKIDLEDTACVLLGDVSDISTTYQLLNKYLDILRLADRPQNKTYCTELSELPSQYYYNLFCLQ